MNTVHLPRCGYFAACYETMAGVNCHYAFVIEEGILCTFLQCINCVVAKFVYSSTEYSLRMVVLRIFTFMVYFRE